MYKLEDFRNEPVGDEARDAFGNFVKAMLDSSFKGGIETILRPIFQGSPGDLRQERKLASLLTGTKMIQIITRLLNLNVGKPLSIEQIKGLIAKPLKIQNERLITRGVIRALSELVAQGKAKKVRNKWERVR